MNRPRAAEFLLGNRGGIAATLGLAAYALYRWAALAGGPDEVSWIFPALTVLLARSAITSAKRVEAYRRWTGAWNETAGIAPQDAGAATRKRQMAFNVAAYIALWFVLFGWLLANPQAASTPRYTSFKDIVELLSLAGGALAVLPLARRIKRLRGSATRRGREHVVSVCLGVPWRSPRLPAITAALPAYCRELLSRNEHAPTPATHEFPPN